MQERTNLSAIPRWWVLCRREPLVSLTANVSAMQERTTCPPYPERECYAGENQLVSLTAKVSAMQERTNWSALPQRWVLCRRGPWSSSCCASSPFPSSWCPGPGWSSPPDSAGSTTNKSLIDREIIQSCLKKRRFKHWRQFYHQNNGNPLVSGLGVLYFDFGWNWRPEIYVDCSSKKAILYIFFSSFFPLQKNTPRPLTNG